MGLKGEADMKVSQYKVQLLQAAESNDLPPVRSFLQEQRLHLDLVKNEEKQNLLHVACKGGAEDVLDMMLKSEKVLPKIHTKDSQGRTALHLAAAMGFDGVVKQMLRVNADADTQDNDGCTPLQLAVRFEWADAARTLLEAGANPMLEDKHGDNAVDLGKHKPPEHEVNVLLSGFAGLRRETTTFQSLKEWLFPRGAKPPQVGPHLPTDSEEEGGEGAPGTASGPAPQQIGARRLDFEDDEDAAGKDGGGSQHPRWPPQASGSKSSSSGVGLSSALAEAVETTSQHPGARSTAKRQASASGAGGVFRLHLYFGEQVQRLEFEVEWHESQPLVGNVRSNGEAERRGLARGDQLMEISGQRTRGRSREELLPFMKQRPLSLQVERKASAPQMELSVTLNETKFSDHGLEVGQKERPLAVTAVRPNSKAWAAGLLPGDIIVSINGEDAAKSSSIAADTIQTITIWRKPVDADPDVPSGEAE